MKEIKVYLQYPWKFPDSPYYKYLIQDHPKNIKYLNVKNQKGVFTNYNKLFISYKLKLTIRKIIDLFKISIINAPFTKTKQKYDLIHCAHCLSKNKNKPWVADFEGKWQFYVGKGNSSSKRKVYKILLNKNCKKIISWTNEVKKDILKEFPNIEDKIEVVYPAIPEPKIKRKKHSEINLLFIARYFYGKGGLHALEAINQLTKKYKDVKGIIISETPKELLEKYSKNPKIKFYKLMPQEKLFEKIYPISDIFIYPGYRDSFGFAILESISFGIPVITVNGFAREEIINEGKTGFIIKKKFIGKKVTWPEMENPDEEIVQKLVEKTEILIKNKKLRNKMSKNCIKTVKSGQFSIKERNKKIKKIYEEVLK